MSLFLCLAGVAVYVWPRVQVVRLAYRTQTSEQHLRELLQAHDQLRFELASLKNPERIYRIATEQLGMGMPRRDQVVIVTHEPQSR
jgi:cell division protein FtsL